MLRKKPMSRDAALLKMADLCARAEHSSHEIREKLRRDAMSAADTDYIIDYLEQNRYIDNSRYARAFARDKVRFSAWGRNKIRAALAMKRIPSPEIREALDQIDPDDYLSAAFRAAQAKSRSLDISDYKDRMKLFRHLASRGFESGIISQAIRELNDSNE